VKQILKMKTIIFVIVMGLAMSSIPLLFAVVFWNVWFLSFYILSIGWAARMVYLTRRNK
jgi:hypothetical protein